MFLLLNLYTGSGSDRLQLRNTAGIDSTQGGKKTENKYMLANVCKCVLISVVDPDP